MNAVVHEARHVLEDLGTNADYALLSVDVRNAFNLFSRQRSFDFLAKKVPSLCRFLNVFYTKRTPSLLIAAANVPDIPSQTGAQRGDPASIRVFSLVPHPLAKEIEAACPLGVHRWYADDCTLVGTHK